MADEPDESIEEPDGIAARLGRMALGPARAAARSGREALTGEAERAIDGVLSGPLPEAVAHALVEHRVVERALAEWLETMAAHQGETSPERERLARAFEQALASPVFQQRITDVAERVVQTEGFKHALSATLESPEIRSALARQTAGFGGEIAGSLRGRSRRLDDRVEAGAHRVVGRRPVEASSRFGGVATRAFALVVDLLLAHAAYLLAAGSVALIASLAGSLRSGWLDGAIAAGAWAVVVAAYFVFFWSTTGQTPGMRPMRLRVVGSSGAPPSVWRSLVRFVGLILAIIPLFLGFVPVLFDGRRRALQDYLAGTAVVAETPAA